MIKTKNWEVESHFGNMNGQFEMGKFLLRSGEKADIDRGIKLLNAAGAQGLKEAYYEVGNYYAVRPGQYKKENQKAIANAFELSGPSDKAAYRLASLYFLNYSNFPDVEDAHIIKLARQSAESGDARGQEFLAERLTDGTMVERDLIGALKWALISNHSRRGVLSLEDERSIARFETGLPEADVQTAQAQAEAWVAQNENQKRE